MLILSRKMDESIMIGEDIVVTVVYIRGDKVRLGINAPKEIPVHRQEVYDAMQRSDRRASGSEDLPNKPAEYINSKYYSPEMLCPNLDVFNNIDSKLGGMYNF